MWNEFKTFIARGNVIDLAVGVIIGAAFGAIVASLVGDIIMPIVGAVTGGLDFSNYYVPLSSKIQAGMAYADAKKAGAALGYGSFITVAINFIIVAFVLFLVIRAMNMLINRSKKEEAATCEAEVAGRKMSVGVIARPAMALAANQPNVSCVCVTPLGLPVLPEVKKMNAGASGGGEGKSATAGSRSIKSSSRVSLSAAAPKVICPSRRCGTCSLA